MIRIGAALTVALSLGAAAPAGAQDGRRWPGRTITYHETPKNLGVRDAAKAWNRSGVRIRFKRTTSRRRADVLVRIGPKGCAGFAQLGYAPGRQAQMQVLDCPRHDQMLVSAHEFGHILGLGHEKRACALMNPALHNGAPERCEPPGPGFYRCRVFERHDLRRAIRKYGGTPKVRRQANCHLYPPPPPLAGFEALSEAEYDLRVRVTLGEEPEPRVETFGAFGSQARVEIAQAAGACPADVTPLFATPVQDTFAPWGRTEELYLEPLEGPQCVAARVVDADRVGPPSAATVTPPAPQEPPPPEEQPQADA